MDTNQGERIGGQIDERTERVMPSSFIHSSYLLPEEAAKRDSRDVIEANRVELHEIIHKLTQNA